MYSLNFQISVRSITQSVVGDNGGKIPCLIRGFDVEFFEGTAAGQAVSSFMIMKELCALPIIAELIEVLSFSAAAFGPGFATGRAAKK